MRTGPLQRCIVPPLAAIAAASLAACTPSPEQLAAEHGATVTKYCTDCHSAAEREADLVLENPDLVNPAAERAKWEAVVHKLSAGLMPPPGRAAAERRRAREPRVISRRRLSTPPRPEPAGAPVRRLTRAAYGNAVRDLLGFPVDVEALLPADITSDGFDNVSDTLKTSPLLLERYLTVGLRVAAMAVGDTTLSPRGTEYRPRLDLSQNDWIEGLPFGTRGGLVVDHYFPTDAEYEIRPELWRATGSTVRGVEGFKDALRAADPARRRASCTPPQFGGVEDDALSNRDIGSAVMQVAARLPVRLRVSAGLHSVGVTFVAKSFALEQKLLDPDRADLPIGNDGYGWPIVTRALVAGPYDSTGSGDTPTRRAIFTCRPSDSVSDTACADEILGRFALRAYGRPLDDQDRQTLRELYASGSDNGRDFEAGIEVGLARILSGPEFLLYHGVTEDAAVAASRQPGRRRHARVAARAVPLEQHSGRRAARCRHRRPAPRARNARSRSAQNARRSARRHARHGLRRAMAAAAAHQCEGTRSAHVPDVRRQPAPRHAARDRAVLALRACSRTRACSTCSAPTTRS